LARVFAAGLEVDKLAGSEAATPPMASALANGLSKSFVALASAAGKLLADPEGPRLAAINYEGWDTHANEGAAEGRLSNLLSGFDALLAALRTAMARLGRHRGCRDDRCHRILPCLREYSLPRPGCHPCR